MSIRKGSKTYWLYGAHAVTAALANPKRVICRIAASRNAVAHLEGILERGRHPSVEEVDGRFFERLLSADAVHQGLAAEVEPLEERGLEALSGTAGGPLVL